MSEMPFKRLLTLSRTPTDTWFRSDYTLNLYRGCNHGCVYCDSRSVCYHMEEFDRVRVKRDCLTALDTELRGKKRAGVVAMGAASDAYNALERERNVTRAALELFLRYGFGVFLPTKSELIARDAELFGALNRVGYACVAFSITTGDAPLAAFLEPHAPPPERRFAAMAALAGKGAFTGIWMNPMLPFLTDTEENIRDVLTRTARAGGRFAICHFSLTLREGDREYFYRALDADARFAQVKAKYIRAFGLDYLCPSPRAEHLSRVFDETCDELHLLRDFASVNREAAAGEPQQLRL